MDRLESMTVLLVVVEAGSLSAAARRLRTALATVSRKVAELERKLGANLLVRGQRRVELTASGRAYVDAIRPLLDQLREAERTVAGEYDMPQGELAITAPPVFGRRYLLPLLFEFLAAHPKIRARVLLVDHHVDLIDERMDVALRLGPVKDATLVSTRVGSVTRMVCGSPAYFGDHGVPDCPEDLHDHEAIGFQGFSASNGWAFQREGVAFTIVPPARLTVNSTEGAVEAALAGLGLTRVLSYQIEDQLRAGALQAVLTGFAPRPTPVSLVYSSRARVPLKVRTFIDWVRPRLRSRLSQAPRPEGDA